MESVKFTRKNEECRPFEVGGEQRLEFYASKAQCGLFALGSHTKKRPHNLVLGRFYDGHLYDAIELGVERLATINSYGNKATGAGLGAKVRCIASPHDSLHGLPFASCAYTLPIHRCAGCDSSWLDTFLCIHAPVHSTYLESICCLTLPHMHASAAMHYVCGRRL